MNGRIYDPELGRMLSPDPNVPDPTITQEFNRYAYVRNNPLSYTDPTGFSIFNHDGSFAEAPNGNGTPKDDPDNWNSWGGQHGGQNDRYADSFWRQPADPDMRDQKVQLQFQAAKANAGYVRNVRIVHNNIMVKHDLARLGMECASCDRNIARALKELDRFTPLTDAQAEAFQKANVRSIAMNLTVGAMVDLKAAKAVSSYTNTFGLVRASELVAHAQKQGWKSSRTVNGPLKFF